MLPSVSQKFSKIRVEPQFSGNDIKDVEDNANADDKDVSDEENDYSEEEEEDDNNGLGKVEENEVDEAESDLNDSDISEEDGNLNDNDSNDTDAKNRQSGNTVANNSKSCESSGNSAIDSKGRKNIGNQPVKKPKNRKNIEKKEPQGHNESSIEQTSAKFSSASKSNKYTPNRKRQFTASASGSFVVEEISSEKKKRSIAEPSG